MGSIDTDEVEKLREQIRLLSTQNSSLTKEVDTLKERLSSESSRVSKAIFTMKTVQSSTPATPITTEPIMMGDVEVTMSGAYMIDNSGTSMFHIYFELKSSTLRNVAFLARISYLTPQGKLPIPDEPLYFEFLQLREDEDATRTLVIPALRIKDATHQVVLNVHTKLYRAIRDDDVCFADDDAMASVVLDDEVIPVNISYLSAWSEFFRGYFASKMKESNDEVYPIEDCTADEFRELLQVIYPSCKPISQYNVKNLLDLADRFIIPSLTRKCEIFLADRSKHNLSHTHLLTFADDYRLSFLQAIVLESTTADQLHKNVIAKEEYKSYSEELKKAIDTRYVESKVPERNKC